MINLITITEPVLLLMPASADFNIFQTRPLQALREIKVL